LDFDDTVETVRAIVTRLNSPVSEFNLVFSESDESVEVSVETSRRLDPLFVFVVDAERLRVIKDTEINPAGYKSVTYSGCVELLSHILENFYPIFFKINHGVSIMEMLSRLFGENIRIWKDLVRVICEAGDVEFFDFGDTVSLLDTNFSYNLGSHMLVVSGKIDESIRCVSVMELVVALLTFIDFLFKRDELEINPILKDSLVDEGEFDFAGMEDTLGMESDIDAAAGDFGMGGGMDDGMVSEDLSSEFEPSEENMTNFAPDVDEGKTEILDEVYGE
jgi:hypothetical protein